MRKALYIAIFLFAGAGLKASDGPIRLLSLKYFNTSYSSELGMTFFTGYVRSPMMNKVYEIDQTRAYPLPVYTWVYPLGILSYEPKLRLLEFGSANSLTLNLPIAAGLSVVQAVDANRTTYDPNASEIPNVFGPDEWSERSGVLGTGHLEFGGLIGYNLGQNATVENTWPIGVNISAGYNFIYAPIAMTTGEDRSDYADVAFWNHIVGKVGLDFGVVGIAHMFGLNTEEVLYEPRGLGTNASVNTRIYHRFMMTIHIGK